MRIVVMRLTADSYGYLGRKKKIRLELTMGWVSGPGPSQSLRLLVVSHICPHSVTCCGRDGAIPKKVAYIGDFCRGMNNIVLIRLCSILLLVVLVVPPPCSSFYILHTT